MALRWARAQIGVPLLEHLRRRSFGNFLAPFSFLFLFSPENGKENGSEVAFDPNVLNLYMRNGSPTKRLMRVCCNHWRLP